MDTDGHRSEGVTKRPQITRRVKDFSREICTAIMHCNHASSRMFDKDLETGFFFLPARRRSGERTEERGKPKTRLLSRPSPPLHGGEGVVAASPRCVHLRFPFLS